MDEPLLVFQNELKQLQNPFSHDEIVQCGIDVAKDFKSKARVDELFELADQKIHVFPFKNVPKCWFRLYTDTSIIRAIILINELEKKLGLTGEHSLGSQIVSEIVRLLDMALIMAGGVGHEQMIQVLLDWAKSRLSLHSIPRKRPGRLHSTDHRLAAEVQQQLPLRTTSIPAIRKPIQRSHRPPLLTFQKHMNENKIPVILTGTLDHWPAMDKWSFKEHWLDQTIDGKRLVPIEVGRSYTDDDWGQKIVPFHHFLDEYICHEDSQADTNRGMQGSIIERQTGYLAQHDLLQQIPALRAEIATPDYCFLDAPPAEPGTPVALSKLRDSQAMTKTSHPSLIPSTAQSLTRAPTTNSADGEDEDTSHPIHSNIWFGPPWTISPLHHDPYHNILCQIVGKKYIRLYSPHDSAQLHPRSSTETAPHLAEPNSHKTLDATATINMSNTSSIDVAAMELSPAEDWDAVYPGISSVPYVECVLEAGEALYIPVGWWHYVRSCSTGISVSFWWGR